MQIREATFISSITQLTQAPEKKLPEFGFIGRSNVGKSSLINMLVSRKNLAKTSSKPGKTQTINHFLINNSWYLVDLPGYGYAKTSKSIKKGFGPMIERYVLKSEQLHCLFILIDIRLEPQQIDLEFIEWVGSHGVPIALVFTKSDKLSANGIRANVQKYERTLLKRWEELPFIIITSAEKGTGRDDILDFIEESLKMSKKNN